MHRIKLSGMLDEDEAAHRVGLGLYAVNDGSLARGEWDLQMITADNWLATDYGEGIAVDNVVFDGASAICTVAVTDHDAEANRDCRWSIDIEMDQRYVVEEDA